LRSKQKANSVLVDGADGYWLFGNTDSHDLLGPQWDESERKDPSPFYKHTPRAASITRIARDGTVAWQKVYGSLQGEHNTNDALCGVTSDGGVIVFGQKPGKLPISSLTGTMSEANAPWVFKINDAGDIQWEFLIQQDQNKVIVPATTPQSIFSKPFVDAKGDVFFAVKIVSIGIVADESGHGTPDLQIGGETTRTLLIKIDSKGKEIARYTVRGYATQPVLLPSHDGCDVFFTDKDRGFTHIRLNTNLELVFTRSFIDGEFRPYAATPGPNQSFHLFGNSFGPGHAAGRATLGLLDGDGTLKHKEHFENQSWSSDMVAGDNPNEVVILFTSGNEQVVKAIKYKLKT
jgi:hypothetical protein